MTLMRFYDGLLFLMLVVGIDAVNLHLGVLVRATSGGELMSSTWHGVACAAQLAIHHANTRNASVVPEFANLPADLNLTATLADTTSTAPGGIHAYRGLRASGVQVVIGPCRRGFHARAKGKHRLGRMAT